ncbi:hypothetical protein HS121_12410 [bacterium]|nr:hypothetical protein [bacterium]
MFIIVFFLVVGCGHSNQKDVVGCEGVDFDRYVSFNERQEPLMDPDLALYCPECADEVLLANGLENVHVATFEERRAQFGAEWEEDFYKETCIHRTWNGRRPTICIP